MTKPELCSAKNCQNPAETEIDGKPYCQHHYEQLVGEPVTRETYYSPILTKKDSVMATIIPSIDGVRATSIPKAPKKKEEAEEGAEGEKIDWTELAGAEPIDELLEYSNVTDLVLAAEYAESKGEVTAPEVASYLYNHTESSFTKEDKDKARKSVLDRLANLGIVKKTDRKRERSAVIYSYLEGEREWWKS